MKYQLPTGHWIYFAVQIKREKLDARGGSGDKNTATVLDQVRMALDHPVFDPETNCRNSVPAAFVNGREICTPSLTNPAVRVLARYTSDINYPPRLRRRFRRAIPKPASAEPRRRSVAGSGVGLGSGSSNKRNDPSGRPVVSSLYA